MFNFKSFVEIICVCIKNKGDGDDVEEGQRKGQGEQKDPARTVDIQCS